MKEQRYILRNHYTRTIAARRIMETADEPTMEVIYRRHDPKRSLPQNDRIHPMVRGVAQWMGESEQTVRWTLCADFFGTREIPTRDGEVLVVPRKTTSELTKREASDFMDWLAALMVEWGIEEAA